MTIIKITISRSQQKPRTLFNKEDMFDPNARKYYLRQAHMLKKHTKVVITTGDGQCARHLVD